MMIVYENIKCFIGRVFGFRLKRGMSHVGLAVVTYGRCLLVDGDRR